MRNPKTWFLFGTIAILALGIIQLLAMPGLSQTPQVGEGAGAIVQRLGPPEFDSRLNGDPADDYRLGYTLRLGTRHHLHVQGGVVTEIEYSSR